MKKLILLACAAVMMTVSCTKDLENRVGALESDVAELQQQMTELSERLNDEVDDLKALINALKENVYVTGVTEIKEGDKVVGYTIALSKGQAITIYHGTDGKNGNNGLDGKDGQDGQDGETPVISVILEDGVYYWAVNGVVLTDADGNRVAVYAESDAPEFKFENGQWYISIDGQQWSPLASSGSTTGGTFSEVRYDDASVTFVLADGTEIILPRTAVFSLNIESTHVTVVPGETLSVAYSITGATETTVVYAMADEGYTAKVESANMSEGVIAISTPAPLTDGKVVVLAGDSRNAAMATISFAEGVVNIEKDEYTITQEGGEILIPVSTNYEYEVCIEDNASWLTYIETKAIRNETIVLKAAANSSYARKANVTLKSGEKVWCTFTVSQEGTSSGNLSVESLIGKWTVSYISTANVNLSFTMPIEASDDDSKGNLILRRWFNKNKENQTETIYATFNAGTMTLSIADSQKIAGSYNDPGRAKDKDGNWLDPIVFTVSDDGKTLSIDPDVQFGTYFLSQFTSFGTNYTLTKQE